MQKIDWKNGQAGGTPLSAENLNLMQQNIENAINGVQDNLDNTIQSSSNYLKFSDGTLICFGSVSGIMNLIDYWQQFKRSDAGLTFNFPTEFIAVPKVLYTPKDMTIVAILDGTDNTRQGKYTVLKPNNNDVGREYKFDYCAIGRWK